MNKFAVLAILVAVFSVSFSACAQPAQNNNVLAPDAFKEKLAATPNALLIDVRTPEEVAECQIAGASNINFNAPDFKAQMEKLDRTRPLFIYCAAGGRSAKACNAVKDMGFPVVYDLKGGFNAWRNTINAMMSCQ